MVARVVPILHLPRALSSFDYEIPDGARVQVGSLVAIPFRRRVINGVVVDRSSTSMVPEKKLRPLHHIRTPEAYVSPPLLSVASRLSDERFVSLGTVFHHFEPKRRVAETVSPTPGQKNLSPQVRENLASLAPAGITLTVVQYRKDRTKVDYYQRLLEAAKSSHSTVLLIAPTVEKVQQLAQVWPQAIIFHRQLPQKVYREQYDIIRLSTPAIVIGTRSAIFSPLSAYGIIVVDDEDADEHVQREPNPQYDVRQVASWLSAITGAPLVFSTRFMSQETAVRNPVVLNIDQPTTVRIEAIDLTEQARAGDFGLLRQPTIARIQTATARQQPVFILHARKADYGAVVCRDCGFIPACQICHVALHVVSTRLSCTHCGFQQEFPLFCPRCHGTRLHGSSPGISIVQQEIHRSLRPHGPLIRVITPADLNGLPDGFFGLAVVTRLESFLAYPRIDAEERWRRILHTIAAKLNTDGRLIIQSHRPSSSDSDDTWRVRDRRHRDIFQYPPQWRLTVLRRRSQARSAAKSADAVRQELQGADFDLSIIGPVHSLGRSARDPGGDVLILRSRQEWSSGVKHILCTLEEGWTISIDPKEIH